MNRPNYFYFSVMVKDPTDMTFDQLMIEVNAGQEVYNHAEENQDGISTKESGRHRKCCNQLGSILKDVMAKSGFKVIRIDVMGDGGCADIEVWTMENAPEPMNFTLFPSGELTWCDFTHRTPMGNMNDPEGAMTMMFTELCPLRGDDLSNWIASKQVSANDPFQTKNEKQSYENWQKL